MADGQTLYVAWIRGGSPFELASRANPPFSHDGSTSVAHLVLSQEEALQIKEIIEDFGCSVSLEPLQGQTVEQEQERLSLLGVGKEHFVWPSQLCPMCSWFDPLQNHPCGKVSWDFSTTDAFMKVSKAKEDWEKCDAKDLLDDERVD